MKIIVYVMDTVRADHLSCYGYHRETTPNIDEVNKDSICFTNAYTNSTFTATSSASILTSTYPPVHKIYSPDSFIPEGMQTFPYLLGRTGFHTFGITPRIVARPLFLNRDLNRWINLFPFIRSQKLTQAKAMNKAFRSYLRKNKDEDDQFFLLWSMQTRPDTPGPGVPTKFQRFSRKSESDYLDNYDDRLYYTDYCLGCLIDWLKEQGDYDESLIVISSDHGEALGEWGVSGHVELPVEGVLHVPLIIKFPNSEYGGTKCNKLVELVDLFPTIVGYLRELGKRSVIPDWGWQGKNILDAIDKKRNLRDYTYSATASLTTKRRNYTITNGEKLYIQISRKLSTPSKKKEGITHHIRKRILELNRIKNLGGKSLLRVIRRSLNEFLGTVEERLATIPEKIFMMIPDKKRILVRKKDDPDISNFKSKLLNWVESCEEEARSYRQRETKPDKEILERLKALGYI